ncbi:MAG: hypothetical protein HY548_07620, partial [Elusimicrobia bacterium]|nr:hypothetical protein [Elusimicrobiota bacterium]
MLSCLFVFSVPRIQAAAPGEINYQGKLADSDGNPVTGNVPMVFEIYEDAAGGSPIYTETRPGVSVSNGVFSVVIGEVTPISASKFQGADTGKWLQVTVNGTQLLPRQKLVASPYALALAADGVGSAEVKDYSLMPVDISTTSDPVDGRLLSYDAGKFKWVDPNAASQWVTSVNDIYYNTGNVGIGTAGPSAALHIKAGTSSLAPLKFTAGAGLATAQAGAMEWDGTNLYVTQTAGPTRKTVAYADAFQPLDNDLTAVAGLSATGLVARTGSGTASVRSLAQPAAGITVANGDGAGGNPTLALANDLSALEGLSSTGLAVRTGTDAWAQRTITGTLNKITVTNGDGAGGNPTLNIGSDVVTLADAQVLTYKSIGSTGLTFSGATNDITTGTNEHLALMPNGTGSVGIGKTDP